MYTARSKSSISACGPSSRNGSICVSRTAQAFLSRSIQKTVVLIQVTERSAIAVWKQIQELGPTALKVRLMLLELHFYKGNLTKAVDENIAIAQILALHGHLQEAGQVLERGLRLVPKSRELRLGQARISLLQRDGGEAIH